MDCCGKCYYNWCHAEKRPGGKVEFICGNHDSENYGAPTAYDDCCEDFEEKDE